MQRHPWQPTRRPFIRWSVARRDGKPLLRGWFHACAALGAMGATAGLLNAAIVATDQWLALLVFGLSMVLLYTTSAV